MNTAQRASLQQRPALKLESHRNTLHSGKDHSSHGRAAPARAHPKSTALLAIKAHTVSGGSTSVLKQHGNPMQPYLVAARITRQRGRNTTGALVTNSAQM
jgi:hypothetical protein